MARPHPALIKIAAGVSPGDVDDAVVFVESAVEHRMAGLAHWAAETGQLVLDSSARQQLAALKLAAMAHGAKVERAAASVVKQLRDHGWDGAVFKGIATEKRWYPESGTRPTSDVDMFLSPACWSRLNEILEVLSPGHPLIGQAQILVDQGRIQSVDFQHEGVWIDLHVDPIKVGISLPGIESLWERRQSLMLGTVQGWALDGETSLVQAAVHLQKDRFSRLYGYADIARIAATDPDWQWVHSFAAQTGLAVHFNETLRTVATTLDIDLPDDPAARSRLWHLIWSERSQLRGAVGMTRRVRTHYWIPFMMPGRRLAALKWWLRLIFPAKEIVDYMHPDTSGPYLWRLVQFRSRWARHRHMRNREQRRSQEL